MDAGNDLRPDGILLDLDGVVYEAGEPVPGAAETIVAIRRAGLPVRFVTNTTRRPRRALAARLRAMGVPVEEDELFTAPRAALSWLEERGVRRLALRVPEAVCGEFARFERVEAGAQAVVVGDLGRNWTFDLLDSAFRLLLDGARLLALQKNRFWKSEEGLVLDAGPFVAALEYAAGVEAVVVGKPAAPFYEAAAGSMGLPPFRTAMVGDDIETDVGGAQAVGAAGILVRTGKFREETLARSSVRPDRVLASVADLPGALGL